VFGSTFGCSKFITFSPESAVSKHGLLLVLFQKWFDVDALGFHIELCYRYFGLFLPWRL
jgi:hypothetical protein